MDDGRVGGCMCGEVSCCWDSFSLSMQCHRLLRHVALTSAHRSCNLIDDSFGMHLLRHAEALRLAEASQPRPRLPPKPPFLPRPRPLAAGAAGAAGATGASAGPRPPLLPRPPPFATGATGAAGAAGAGAAGGARSASMSALLMPLKHSKRFLPKTTSNRLARAILGNSSMVFDSHNTCSASAGFLSSKMKGSLGMK